MQSLELVRKPVHFCRRYCLDGKCGADWSKPIGRIYIRYRNTLLLSIQRVSIWVADSTGTCSLKWWKHQTDWGLGIEAGYAYFLSRNGNHRTCRLL